MDYNYKLAKNLVREASCMQKLIYNEIKIISSISGMRVEDLKSSIKSISAVKKKLNSKGMNFNDVLRFTLCCDTEDYVNSVNKVYKYICDNSWEVVDYRNAWLDNKSYKGINLDIRYGSYTFELQLHTCESRDFRNGSDHLRYQKIRYGKYSEVQVLKWIEEAKTEAKLIPEPLNLNKIELGDKI